MPFYETTDSAAEAMPFHETLDRTAGSRAFKSKFRMQSHI